MTEEGWREIRGFPGYQVSSHGQIRSGAKIKTQGLDRKGYRRVVLWLNANGHTRLVAPLVADAFNGPKPNGQVVRHLDGDKANNHYANLAYGTPSENELDKRLHGTAPIGENHPAAKLTRQQVEEIRARHVKGCRINGSKALGKEFGVTGSLVRYIVIRKLWKQPNPERKT